MKGVSNSAVVALTTVRPGGKPCVGAGVCGRVRVMRIIFSRKGFDSAAGGGPSPIIDGRPVTLPIPGAAGCGTTYGSLGLGQHAAKASRGRYDEHGFCHHDPMFLADGTCLFGQVGAAQSHLANQGVGPGDVFLFFGLFREERQPPHHRIFGYLAVAEVVPLNGCAPARLDELRLLGHPHALRREGQDDTIYVGQGRKADHARDTLRLSVPGASPSLWRRPDWLRQGNLTYHQRADRWLSGDRLRSAPRGQEFVARVDGDTAARRWLDLIIAEIRGS